MTVFVYITLWRNRRDEGFRGHRARVGTGRCKVAAKMDNRLTNPPPNFLARWPRGRHRSQSLNFREGAHILVMVCQYAVEIPRSFSSEILAIK